MRAQATSSEALNGLVTRWSRASTRGKLLGAVTAGFGALMIIRQSPKPLLTATHLGAALLNALRSQDASQAPKMAAEAPTPQGIFAAMTRAWQSASTLMTELAHVASNGLDSFEQSARTPPSDVNAPATPSPTAPQTTFVSLDALKALIGKKPNLRDELASGKIDASDLPATLKEIPAKLQSSFGAKTVSIYQVWTGDQNRYVFECPVPQYEFKDSDADGKVTGTGGSFLQIHSENPHEPPVVMRRPWTTFRWTSDPSFAPGWMGTIRELADKKEFSAEMVESGFPTLRLDQLPAAVRSAAIEKGATDRANVFQVASNEAAFVVQFAGKGASRLYGFGQDGTLLLSGVRGFSDFKEYEGNPWVNIPRDVI